MAEEQAEQEQQRHEEEEEEKEKEKEQQQVKRPAGRAVRGESLWLSGLGLGAVGGRRRLAPGPDLDPQRLRRCLFRLLFSGRGLLLGVRGCRLRALSACASGVGWLDPFMEWLCGHA